MDVWRGATSEARVAPIFSLARQEQQDKIPYTTQIVHRAVTCVSYSTDIARPSRLLKYTPTSPRLLEHARNVAILPPSERQQ